MTLEVVWQDQSLVLWGRSSSGERLDEGSLRAAAGAAANASPDFGRPHVLAGAASLLLWSHETAMILATPPACAGDSFQWFALLESFVAQRIAAGQFYPSAESGPQGLRGLWRPVVSNPDEVAWLQQMATALPRALFEILGLHAEQDEVRQELVESFIVRRTDSIIRGILGEDSFFAETARRCRSAEASDDMRWLAALVDSDAAVIGSGGDFLNAVRQWTAPVEPTQPQQATRIVFELVPAPEESAPWLVRFLLQEAEGEIIPAHTLWECGDELPAVLGRGLSARRERLREELLRAREHWPVLQRLDDATPTEIEITPAEALALMRQWAPLLREAGFDVRLPGWASNRPRQMTIHLAVRPAEVGLATPSASADAAGGAAGDAMQAGASQLGLGALLEFDWELAIGDMRLGEEQFIEILSRQQPLVLVGGEWVEVDVAAAQRAMEFINKQGKGKMTLADALRTAHSATREETGLEVSGLVGSSWIDSLLQNTPDAGLAPAHQPAAFQGSLRPYQLRGLEWLVFLQRLGIGACLADDMGLGKTIQLISLLLLEREAGAAHPGPTLLFAPTSVMSNWVREMQRFAPQLRVASHHGPLRLHGKEFRGMASESDLVVTSYALATRDVEDLRSITWHRLALDEAQKIKNPSASSTGAIRSIMATHRVALTGTPIENHLSELWSIMDVLNPGLLGTSGEFRERFAVPIERQGDSSRAEHLRSFVRPFVLRRTKSDPAIAGDLPEKMEMPVYCNLTVEQASLYQRITEEMLGQIDSATGIRRRGLILAALTRLKQVCDHPRLLSGKLRGVSDSTVTEGRSGKCERLAEMLEEVMEVGECALVFTQFKEMGDVLEQFLITRLGVPVLYLHGGTPALQRDQLVRDFQDPASKSRVFILSLRAGGLGLNLTRANHVFHFDRWWNPAVEQQATDRAHRIGQTRRVEVHKYICIGTMEERIDKLLKEKVDLADRIVTSGDEWLTSLSTDELRKTLQLSGDAVEDYSAGAGA